MSDKPNAAKAIPLVDLAAQHASKEPELRAAMDAVIANTRFINGKEVKELESQFARFCGVEYCVGTSNGTSALTLTLRALRIGPGDEVITVPHTFIATVEAILAVGARPVFVDIDRDSFNIDAQLIEGRLTPRTRAVLPVHLYGNPAPMEAIVELAGRHRLAVVGDAAQAHGAELDGKKLAQWADATCFSFFPGKNLGAYGDAGTVVTPKAEIAGRVAMLKDHGRQDKYLHQIAGDNCRLDTLQAAILLVKLKYLDQWNDARRRVAERYREGLDGLPVELPRERPGARHVYHQFVLRTPKRDALREHLQRCGVATGIHYPVPLHLQPALRELGYAKGDFPVTEKAADEILSLPMYPELSEAQVARIVEGIRSFFGVSG